MRGRSSLVRMVTEGSRPIDPVPPDLDPSLRELVDRPLPRRARAVLFDLYGTLFVSASGEIGTASPPRSAAFAESVRDTFGIELSAQAADGLRAAFERAVVERHDELREAGVSFPEVDIRRIWRRVLRETLIAERCPPGLIEEIAVRHEIIVNPVWPMPGSETMLMTLSEAGLALGIVSNAQFYTALLFPALFGRRSRDLGFAEELIACSYRHGVAKPDPQLLHGPLAVLERNGIDCREVLCVGNDMLNDVYPAARTGCMTALFAGDERSLRLRRGRTPPGGVLPDTVITDLRALARLCCAGAGGHS